MGRALIFAWNWTVNKPNPLVQIFYLAIALGGFFIFVRDGFKYLPTAPYLATYHKYTGSIVMFFCYYSFYKACTVDPGVIKTGKEAKALCKRYIFDGVMFLENNECATCKFVKPARSKHC